MFYLGLLPLLFMYCRLHTAVKCTRNSPEVYDRGWERLRLLDFRLRQLEGEEVARRVCSTSRQIKENSPSHKVRWWRRSQVSLLHGEWSPCRKHEISFTLKYRVATAAWVEPTINMRTSTEHGMQTSWLWWVVLVFFFVIKYKYDIIRSNDRSTRRYYFKRT